MAALVRPFQNQEAALLDLLIRSRAAPGSLIQRARVILAGRKTMVWAEAGRAAGLAAHNARKWIERFNADGLLGLFDLPRSGRPPEFDEGQALKIVEIVTTEPDNLGLPFKTWSLTKLRRYLEEQQVVESISREGIRSILGSHGLTYQQARTWQESDDPEFETKRDDVVALYTNPPEDSIVICIDQKGPIQVRQYRGPGYAPQGKPRRVPSEYVRHGVAYIFAAFAPHTGKAWTRCFTKCNRFTVIWFLGWLLPQLPPDKVIHIIWDNLSSHKAQDVRDWLARNYGDRVQLHYTPTNASWLNLVEAWLSVIEHDLIRNADYESKAAFRAAVAAYTAYHNRYCHPYRWGHKKKRKKRIFLIRRLREIHLRGRAPAAWVPAPLLRQLAKAYGI